MTVTYGFYNSIGNDRRYNAMQMSSLFDGIINDGVFMSIGDKLIVSAAAGMNINVGTGRAWFKHTWTNNDADILLAVPQSEVVLNRVDAVVLEINSGDAVRANTIKIIKGTPASVPIAPNMVKTELVNQYPLGYIYVAAGVTSIVAANITNKVGTSDCPFITGVLETVNIDALLTQWAGEFNDWFVTLVDILDENTAANLLLLINENAANIAADLETHSENDTTAHGINNKLDKSGGTMSGGVNLADYLLTRPEIKDYAETIGITPATTGTVNIDLETGNTFSITPTGAITFAFLNPPANGKVGSFTLIINNTGTSYSKIFPASVKWDNDIIPDMSTINKTIVLTFVTKDGGNRWYAGSFGTKFAT